MQECVLYPDCWGCVCGQSSSASSFGSCHGRVLLWHCHCWFVSLEQPLPLQAVCHAVQDVCAPTAAHQAGCPEIILPFFSSQLIRDYSTPPNEELSRDLVAKLKPHIR